MEFQNVKQIVGEKIPTIMLVSSPVFNIFSCINPWLAIPTGVTALVGAVPTISENLKSHSLSELNQILRSASDKAMEKVKKEAEKDNSSLTSEQKRIVKELSGLIITPDNLKATIHQTKTYQEQYCNKLDAVAVIQLFDGFFRMEVSKNNVLSNYYALASDLYTIDKLTVLEAFLNKSDRELEEIAKMIRDGKLTLQQIQEDVKDTKKDASVARRLLEKLQHIMWKFLFELGFSFIYIGTFIILGRLLAQEKLTAGILSAAFISYYVGVLCSYLVIDEKEYEIFLVMKLPVKMFASLLFTFGCYVFLDYCLLLYDGSTFDIRQIVDIYFAVLCSTVIAIDCRWLCFVKPKQPANSSSDKRT